jgi:hypothetical protein
MPYTKAQLKNNEHYERVIEAARREQVATFVKDERDFVASGSNAAATQTLRMKTGEFVSIPELEDNGSPAQSVVIPNKTYYVTDDADKFIDKEIKELLNNDPVKALTVSEFFDEYEKLREVISSEGSRDSHRYIVDTSKTYIDTDDDEVQKLKQRLQDEIDRLLSIQATLQETIQESADDAALDAKFAEYQAEMLRYPNTDVAYTRAEWDDKGQPVAAEGNGHPKLRFERQAMGNHKGKTDLKTDIKCTYYGRFAKKNRKLRKGNGPVIVSVKALGDPTISYQWLASDSGLPIKSAWGNKGSNFTGEDTATLTVNMPGKYKNSFGPMVKCKIKDGSGETTSQAVDISRRSVNAGS